MHKIKKIRSLCLVNFWWNLRKCHHFFILSLNKSCSAQFNWDSIFNIANSHSLADFSFSHLKKIHQNRFIRKWKIIPQLSILKQDLVILKMKKCLHYLKFHQKLIKQSQISCDFWVHRAGSQLIKMTLFRPFPTNLVLEALVGFFNPLHLKKNQLPQTNKFP